MNDWREQARQFLIDTLTDPIMLGVYAIIGVTLVGFVLVVISIKRRDKRGGVRVTPGTRASDLVRSGAIPGVEWPEPSPPAPPGSMIVEPKARHRGAVTKIVFVTTAHGHMVNNGPDTVELTDHVQSISVGDTQPIEVTRDGTAQRREPEGLGEDRQAHRPDPGDPSGDVREPDRLWVGDGLRLLPGGTDRADGDQLQGDQDRLRADSDRAFGRAIGPEPPRITRRSGPARRRRRPRRS